MAMTLAEYAAMNPTVGVERGPHNDGTCPACLAAWMRGEDHEVDRPVAYETLLWRRILREAYVPHAMFSLKGLEITDLKGDSDGEG